MESKDSWETVKAKQQSSDWGWFLPAGKPVVQGLIYKPVDQLKWRKFHSVQIANVYKNM